LAIVRELITVLGTAVDTTGFKQYETGIARIKALALSVGAAFGIAFGAEKIIEFADGLVTAGKEINRLHAQLNIIGRPFDDLDASQKRIYETAQLLGTEYKQVFSTFKDFYNEMRDTNIPIEKIEKTTENIFKSLQIGKANREETERVLELFDRSFKRGGMRSVGVGMLSDIAPKIFDQLKLFYKTDEDGLRAMAKAGDLTAEKIIAALGTIPPEIEKEWEKVPQKLDKQFTKIHNDLTLATAAIYKLTDASIFLGRILWFVWVTFRNSILSVVKELGGLKSTVELLGIALAVALGPWLIGTLSTVVGLTLAWAAANALLLGKWILIAGAVAGVAIAIQDLVYWIQGKDSLIGSWVGSFDDLAENFKKLDIFSGFRLFDAATKGNWDEFRKEWDIFKTNLPAEVLAITATIALIGGAFVTIGPIIAGVLKGIIEGLFKTKVAAVAAETAIKGVGGAGTAAVGGAAAATTPKSGAFSNLLGFFATLLPLFLTGSAGGEDPVSSEQKNQEYIQNRKTNGPDIIDRYIGGLIDLYNLPSKFGERMWLGPESLRTPSVVPNVSPGAFNPLAGPRVQHTEINPSLVQNNSIRVETLLDSAQIGSAIQSQMNVYGEQLISGISRQINTAGPRAEQPTQ